MLKKYILIAALVVNSTALFAYKPLDSIGVENNNGKKLIIHKVDPKESYFSISRRYNVNVKNVQEYNKNIGLQIGAIIKIPTDIPFAQKSDNSTPAITSTSFFEYTVAPKDNLNLIAERFATTVNEIKKLNNLNSINLQVGQLLKVPFTKSGTIPQPKEAPIKASPAIAATNTPTVITNTITTHTVKPKEFLNLIAKQYGVSVEDIKALNQLTSNNLQIGQVIKIPIAETSAPTENVEVPKKTAEVAVVTTPPAVKQEEKPKEITKPAVKVAAPIKTDGKSEATFEHVVVNGETIYAIAAKYQLTTYQLKSFNNLTSNDLSVGQKLVIKGEKPLASVANNSDDNDEETTEGGTTLKNPNLKRPAAVYGLNRIEEKGTAVWITDPDLDPNKMLILHRLAPVGTIIQVTNPMTNRSTFAKVVGKFTENETTKDVIIVMTKAVADAVGALDKRFFCNLSYAPKE